MATAGFIADPFPEPKRSVRLLPGAVGRLVPGLSLEQVQARLSAMAAELRSEHPEDYAAEARWSIEIQAVDPGLPLYNVRTLDEVIGRSLAARRFAAGMVSAFAALALLLASTWPCAKADFPLSQKPPMRAEADSGPAAGERRERPRAARPDLHALQLCSSPPAKKQERWARPPIKRSSSWRLADARSRADRP